LAKLFSVHSAKVIVNYFRGKKDAERIIREIKGNDGEAISCYADVSVYEDVEKMVSLVCRKYGTIDILINNAVRDANPVDFLDLTWSDIQKDIDVTLKGAFHCCQSVIPIMVKNGSGNIINVSTVYTEKPPVKQFKYVLSKSGLIGLTRSLAAEYTSKGIRVNMVVPSFMETDLVASVPMTYRKQFAQSNPMHRNASPVETAQTILFLASSYSSYISGQRIILTGGDVPYL
jgi:3-oxoacyl-[acyl-carrier protein] reductase